MGRSFGRVTTSVLVTLIAGSMAMFVSLHRSAHAGEPPIPNAFHLPPTLDLDGDGVVDLIQTRASYNDVEVSLGAVDVFSLVSFQRIAVFGESGQHDVFGIAAAPAGDIDGDGSGDLIIGAPHARPGDTSAGEIHLYSGATGTLIRTIPGPTDLSIMGRSVAGAGDVNGDGIPDVAASGYTPDEDRNPIGQVFVFSGADGAHLRTYTASWIDDGFGFRIESLGDLDGDGLAELAISAIVVPGAPGTMAQGQLSIFNGIAGDELIELDAGEADLTIFNDESDVFTFAALIQRIDDVTGDGRDDLLIGSAFDPDAPEGQAVIDTLDGRIHGVPMMRFAVHDSATGACIASQQALGLGNAGDADHNLEVDLEDLMRVLNEFGQSTVVGDPFTGDLNHNDQIDLHDIAAVTASFGAVSPILSLARDPFGLINRWAELTPHTFGVAIGVDAIAFDAEHDGWLAAMAPSPFFPGSRGVTLGITTRAGGGGCCVCSEMGYDTPPCCFDCGNGGGDPPVDCATNPNHPDCNDTDGDGEPDSEDDDIDGDGKSNGADTDDDGDGIPDGEDCDHSSFTGLQSSCACERMPDGRRKQNICGSGCTHPKIMEKPTAAIGGQPDDVPGPTPEADPLPGIIMFQESEPGAGMELTFTGSGAAKKTWSLPMEGQGVAWKDGQPDETDSRVTVVVTQPGQYRIVLSVRNDCSPASDPVEKEFIVAMVRLAEVIFSQDQPVYRDSDATLFNKPQWKDYNFDGDDEDINMGNPDAGDRRYPVAYVRGTHPRTIAKVQVSPAVAAARVVKLACSGALGVGAVETGALLQIAGETVSGIVDAPPLPNTVRYLPNAEITWSVTFDAAQEYQAGASTNTVYVTLGSSSTVTKAFETCYYLGCKNADGATSEAAVFTGVWGDFANLASDVVTAPALDTGQSSPLIYYGNNCAAPPATTTGALLADHSGRCGSFMCLSIDVLRTQSTAFADNGANPPPEFAVQKILVRPNSATVCYFPGNSQTVGILVKSYSFGQAGGTDCANYAYKLNFPCTAPLWAQGEVTELDGIAGQGCSNPMSYFEDHAMIRFQNKYYDPSYGKGGYVTLVAWEDDALAGFYALVKDVQTGDGKWGARSNTTGLQEVLGTPQPY